MQNLDQQLFLALNFDGGPTWDRVMLTLSGTTMWIPLYVLILWLVWRQAGWRGMVWFLVLMAAAVALADMIAGIFKHNGLLGDLLPDFEPRWRPMFTPSLEGLDIAPDSLRVLRRLSPEALAAAGYSGDWAVHVPVEAVSGRYGSVSAHAATIVTLALLSAGGGFRCWSRSAPLRSAIHASTWASTSRWISSGALWSEPCWAGRPALPTAA